MSQLIPSFDLHRVFIQPWTENFSMNIWIVVMGFFVTAACGLVGNYLIWRRMALVGDAISHSVLPGLVIAFLISHSRSTTAMFLGALAAGVLTTILIELIHKKTRVKQDAAIGIAFTSLFAIGVILVSLYASKVDLDQECVLYGEIGLVSNNDTVKVAQLLPGFITSSLQSDPNGMLARVLAFGLGPEPVVRMGGVALMTVLLIALFYKELLVSSFDAGLATTLGIHAGVIHYALMCWLSVVVVSAFESVGAILVIAMLILPGATASMLSHRLPTVMFLTVIHAALSSVLGLHLAVWLDCSTAGAMVVMATFLFCLAWVFSPTDGLIRMWLRSRRIKMEPMPHDEDAAVQPAPFR